MSTDIRNFAVTIARPGSLTKGDDFGFQSDLAAVRRDIESAISRFRQAAVDGRAVVFSEQQARHLYNGIGLAHEAEKYFSGRKSLLIYLWFLGGGEVAMGVNGGCSFLAGSLNVSTQGIKTLRAAGEVRWECELQGLSLDLFSDKSTRNLRPLLDDPKKLSQCHREILDEYHADRRRVKEDNQGQSTWDREPLPKFISATRVRRYIERDGTTGVDKVDVATSTPAGTVKPDSGKPATSTQTAVIDDGDGIDDMGRVRLRLSEAEEAVEILAGRLSRQRDVQALKLAVHRVADQARAIRLSDEQAAVLWEDRQ